MERGVTQAEVVDTVQRIAAELRRSPAAVPLDLGGIDAADVLLGPAFFGVLQYLRGTDRGGERGWLAGVRERAHGWKQEMAERFAAWRSTPAKRSDILFWPRDVTHYLDQVPVARVLAERGVSCEFLACNAKTFQQLRARGIRATFAAGCWPEAIAAAHQDGRRRVRELEERWPAINNTAVGVEPGAIEAYRRALVKSLPLAVKAVANARATIDQLRPKLIIVGNDITPEGRAACLAAREAGVSTAVLMHGHIYGNPLHALHLAERIVVYGDAQRRELLKLNLEDSRLVTCGAPYLDTCPQQTGTIHPVLARRLGIAAGQNWVLIANSGPGHSVSHAHHQLVLEAMMRLSTKHPDVAFVAKLHRKDHPSFYRAAAGRVGANRLRIVADNLPGYPTSIFDWLQGCRAVFTGSSMVAIEAMLLDVPVITMDFLDEIRDVGFVDAGATLHVTRESELDGSLADVLENAPAVRSVRTRATQFLQDAFYAIDRRSAARTGDALLDQIRPASPGAQTVAAVG